ncbi:hypothetical protein BU24DRAFT_428517 [Aaosphaeria arxii CBS 175.79]|uniref:Uncharacterized protein n=1 Tax=Aaosphaeria arxii CBS 175.79 TaxID=1450172 RepID=A0A6A5X9N3_9PLEO|nr:uncharacterized protein BU24DRAFT_428517 [Aaosphaeria arxii CBS 175.79]KAF2009620.1 hypothetical protein BU24DRAFT_428517 [Aaosphaeria arxii CBS 175.79]
MADVRSLLRQERASRQQATRPQRQSAAPASAPISRKRKAVGDTAEERKRTRTEAAAGVPAGFFDSGVAADDNISTEVAPEVPTSTSAQEDVPSSETIANDASNQPFQTTVPAHPPVSAPDEDLDAFLEEMEQTPAPAPHVKPSTFGAAVIEAAPMTAAEIAAQAREEQSAQREKREEEVEAEKEDADRALQDEFEEMEGLEERVRTLREKREALRKLAKAEEVMVVESNQASQDDDESASEDEDDWDDWRFRAA